MRRRSRVPRDSLDLLLDTMCNAFGGIVLIAILVALLIEKPGDGEREPTPATREDLALTRKVAELTRLEKEIRTTEEIHQENQELIKLIEKRNQLVVALRTRQETEALSMVDLNGKLGELLEEKSKLLTEITGLTTEVAALEETLRKEEDALTRLEAEMKDLIASRMSETHPPELRDASGQQVNFILKHGKIYPLSDMKFSDTGEFYGASENDYSINWIGSAAVPIKEAGLSLEADYGTLQRIFKQISTHNHLHPSRPSDRFYIIFFVYQDSFELLTPLRQLVKSAGSIQDGWEPWIIGKPIAFSSEGKKSQTD